MLVIENKSLSEEIERSVQKYGNSRSALLPILQEVQAKYKHISGYAQQEIARLLDIHPVEVFSVISFYSFLYTEPKGRNIVRLCRTITCDMKGKDLIANAIEREIGIAFGETTKDKKFSLEYANCIGLCDQGPAMSINDCVYTQLTPEKAIQILTEI